jgi:hypothetical protein
LTEHTHHNQPQLHNKNTRHGDATAEDDKGKEEEDKEDINKKKAPTNNSWYVDSDEYQAFAAICEEHNMHKEEKLTRAGNKSPFGKALDT